VPRVAAKAGVARMLRFFFYLHWLGLLALAGGVIAYLMPTSTPVSMVAIASAIGLGLLMISPYPVIKVLQWMMQQDKPKPDDEHP